MAELYDTEISFLEDMFWFIDFSQKIFQKNASHNVNHDISHIIKYHRSHTDTQKPSVCLEKFLYQGMANLIFTQVSYMNI